MLDHGDRAALQAIAAVELFPSVTYAENHSRPVQSGNANQTTAPGVELGCSGPVLDVIQCARCITSTAPVCCGASGPAPALAVKPATSVIPTAFAAAAGPLRSALAP